MPPLKPYLVQPARAQVLALLVAATAGLVGGGVALRSGDPLLVGCGLIAAPLCAIILVDLLRRAVAQRPALVISVAGVLDDTSPFAAGMIYWPEIAEIVVGHQLGFVLTDHRAFLARQPFLRRQRLRLLMAVLTEAHIAIPPGLLAATTSNVLRTLQEYHDAYERAAA